MRGFARAKLFVKTHQPGFFVELAQPATPPARAALRRLADLDVDPLAIATRDQDAERMRITAARRTARRVAHRFVEAGGLADVGAGARHDLRAAAETWTGRTSKIEHL